MTVRLMLTCLCDALYGEVGIASVRVLEHAGCCVEFPEAQTCCGQPAFNAGDWNAARPVALRCAEIFRGSTPVVTPSASCAAMVRHGYSRLMREVPFPCFELCEFLVRERGITRWPLGQATKRPQTRKVAFHRACHGRPLGLGSLQRDLVASVPGIDLVEIEEPEQCCGFGGAFSATHPHLSRAIGVRKLRFLTDSGVREVVGGDMGCLMHLDGLARREGVDLRFVHVAELLAEAVP